MLARSDGRQQQQGALRLGPYLRTPTRRWERRCLEAARDNHVHSARTGVQVPGRGKQPRMVGCESPSPRRRARVP